MEGHDGLLGYRYMYISYNCHHAILHELFARSLIHRLLTYMLSVLCVTAIFVLNHIRGDIYKVYNYYDYLRRTTPMHFTCRDTVSLSDNNSIVKNKLLIRSDKIGYDIHLFST